MNDAAYFDWRPRFVPSSLVLKQTGKRRVVVVRRPIYDKNGYPVSLPADEHRIYGASVNGVVIYDPASEYKVGQVVTL